MNKLLFLIAFIVPATFLQAQNSALDKLFEKYSGADGFTTVYISKAMFEMFADLDTATPAEGDEMQKTLGKLSWNTDPRRRGQGKTSCRIQPV